MIRTILAPIRGDGKGENVLAHAAILARRHGAHIEATHCRPRPDDLRPFGVPLPSLLRDQIVASAIELANAEEQKLRADFDAVVADLGIEVVTTAPRAPSTTPSIMWIEETGKQIDVIKRHGRLADVIVVAKPDRDRNLGANTLKTALFNTGRPVLMCPPRDSRPEALGDRVAVAWNGSLECARAVGLAFELLRAASEVTVVAIGPRDTHVASADALAAYLEARGVAARTLERPAAGGVGAALSAAAQEMGFDLILMGAYSDSHERETILGGVTQSMVDNAVTPVIFVH
ncbi:MAG: universal stress protein [Pseudomonadota bacterium]